MKRFFILFFAAAFFLASASHAGTTYIVKKGDTLQKISKRHHIPVSDIKHANDMKSIKLSTGMKLVIPDRNNRKRETAKKDSPSAKPSKNTSSARNSSDSEPVYHVVKKGDTLKTIATKYSVTAGELVRINNLQRTKLKAGRKLMVKNSAPKPKTYTVKKGDNLYRIAKKFKIDVNELKEINSLRNNSLKPGQEIMLAKKAPEQKNEQKVEQKEENPSHVTVAYDKNSTPVITSEKLQEVKEMSKSEEILTDLSVNERLILFAKKMLHLPYRFGGTGSFGLDCSAYVQKVYGFIGKSIPRSAREQFHQGESVEKKDLSTGDLVFFRTYASFPSHVGIYLGNNLFIHASSLSKKVTIDSLESPYYFKRFIGAKRLIPEEDAEADTPSAVSDN